VPPHRKCRPEQPPPVSATVYTHGLGNRSNSNVPFLRGTLDSTLLQVQQRSDDKRSHAQQRLTGRISCRQEPSIARDQTSFRQTQVRRHFCAQTQSQRHITQRHRPHTAAAAALFCHRQSGQTSILLVCRLMVSTPVVPCNYMDYYSFSNPGGMEG